MALEIVEVVEEDLGPPLDMGLDSREGHEEAIFEVEVEVLDRLLGRDKASFAAPVLGSALLEVEWGLERFLVDRTDLQAEVVD